MKDKFLWNATKYGSVRASSIRNFTVEEDQGLYIVLAWMSDEESIKMGGFDTLDEARRFLVDLHKQIEEPVYEE